MERANIILCGLSAVLLLMTGCAKECVYCITNEHIKNVEERVEFYRKEAPGNVFHGEMLVRADTGDKYMNIWEYATIDGKKDLIRVIPERFTCCGEKDIIHNDEGVNFVD